MSQLESRTSVARRPDVRAYQERAGETHQHLSFSLNGELFAVGILAVKEIIEYAHVTPVPMIPEFIRGVINLRGAAVPVLDLSLRLGKTPNPLSKRTCIIIIEIATAGGLIAVGVIVDAVHAVVDLAVAQIEPPPTFGPTIRSEFVEGIGRINDRFVILLDMARIVSADDMNTLAQIDVPSSRATDGGLLA